MGQGNFTTRGITEGAGMILLTTNGNSGGVIKGPSKMEETWGYDSGYLEGRWLQIKVLNSRSIMVLLGK